MLFDDALKEYKRLCSLAKDANSAYYDEDSPIMEDPEYDKLILQIKKIEKEHPELINEDSPTQKVGGTPSKSSFEKVKHEVPMLSLLDVFSEEEVNSFLDENPNAIYSVEEKIDGLSMSVTYKNGKLFRAETRGDGFIGEDITENAKFIKGIPLQLSNPLDENIFSLLEIRCEVFMPITEFIRLNKEKEDRGEKLFANPRNAAAGMLRTKDLSIVKNAGLHAFVFQIQRYETFNKTIYPAFEQHISSLDALNEMNFSTVSHISTSRNGVMSAIKSIGERRNKLSYWIDGAVVKIDNFKLRNVIGTTAKFPKWAVAFKYPPEEKETVIRDIVLQTGRTGRVTPVAIFDPIFLAGTKVEKATLNNPQFIEKLGVDIGDTVLVRKSAEIIPEIIKVSKKAFVYGTSYAMLTHKCPSCGEPLCADEHGNGCYCINIECPAQLSRRFEFWGSRDCMDIAGFGPAIIDKFISLGWLKTIPDIYRLKEYTGEMMNLDGFGEKATNKLLAAIEKSKDRDIDRLIKSLGIAGVGRHIGKKLAKLYPDMNTIENLSIYQLSQVDGVGNISAQAMYEWFNDIGETSHEEMLCQLEELGINMTSKSYVSQDAKTGSEALLFAGMTFVITGTLPTLKREQAATLIEENGGRVSGSVSKKTNFLLAGENAGSKIAKAQELGIKIISEDELTKMLV